MEKQVTVFAPASVSNLGCGFDVFGVAIESPGDEVTVRWNRLGEVVIRKISGASNLPLEAGKNTAGVAIMNLLRTAGEKRGVDVIIKKKMPLGSGLGSSAASAAAGVMAANILLRNPFSKQELVPFAMEGERIACGAAHADNVAPSLLGGFVLIRSLQPLDIISLPVLPALRLVVIHPHIELLTRDSRAVLPNEIPLTTAVRQWANTAAVVSAVYERDYEALGRAVIDRVAEPHRAALIPAFPAVQLAALEEGALACSISGSGPSVFALATGETSGIVKAMRRAFREKGIGSDAWVSRINRRGARQVR